MEPKHIERPISSSEMSEPCVLCNISSKDTLRYGVLKRTKGISAHYFCVLMSTSISQSGRDHEGILGFLDKDIKVVVDKCKEIKCIYCGVPGASIACFYADCKNSFHFPCGLKNKCSFQFCDNYETFCDTHNHYPKLSREMVKDMKDMHCIACLDSLEGQEETNVVATFCCKIHLIHVDCAKKMAFNAGYFTKCPVCNNTEEFAEGLQYCGVFVPLQDASWERPSGAYSELTDVRRSCDVAECKCPHGKDFNNKSGSWKLLLCNDCGSSAAHKRCIKYHPYLCDTCLVVERVHNDLEHKRDTKRMKIDPDSDN